MNPGMSSKHSAMISWQTPVRPDKLGERLEAFAKAVPVLHALRLCHRFGQGPDVHVTRIPAEIELAVEALVVQDQIEKSSRRSTWASSFRHFEGKCAPMDHGPRCDPMYDALFDDKLDLCGPCEEDYSEVQDCEKACKGGIKLCWTCEQKIDPQNCMRTCQATLHDEMNYLAERYRDVLDEDDCGQWREKTDLSGKFAKYAEVLRCHFGLDVRFMETRIAEEDRALWPRHLNHHHHRPEELKTTLCSLVLAPTVVPRKSFEASEFELECGGLCYSTAQSIPIAKEALDLREADAQRFRRAMNLLCLEPYLHPSQPGSAYSGQTLTNVTTTTTAADASAQRWPQLTLIVQEEVRGWDYM